MNRLLDQGSIFAHLSKEELVNLLESEGLTVEAGHGEIMDADDNVIYSPRCMVSKTFTEEAKKISQVSSVIFNNNVAKVEMENRYNESSSGFAA